MQGVCKYRGPSQGSRCHLLERTALGTHRVTHKTNRVSKSWAQWLSEPTVPTGVGRRDSSDLEEQLSLGVERELGEEALSGYTQCCMCRWVPGHQKHRETGLAIGFWSNMSVNVHLSSW